MHWASNAPVVLVVRISSRADPYLAARAFRTQTTNSIVASHHYFRATGRSPGHVVARAAPDESDSSSNSSNSSNSSDAAPEPPKWWMKDVPDNVRRVTSVQELVDELQESAANDQLVVFECFAPWCGSCKALFHKLKKICKENDDVKFVLLNFEDNRKLAKGLGIKVLPYFHFYRGSDGKVEEMTASISKIQRIKDGIVRHKSPRCYLPTSSIQPFVREYPDVQPSAVNAARETSMV